MALVFAFAYTLSTLLLAIIRFISYISRIAKFQVNFSPSAIMIDRMTGFGRGMDPLNIVVPL